MERIIEQLKRFNNEQPSFIALGEELLKVNFNNLAYKGLLPKIECKDNYARNILTRDPIEVILMIWPPKTESAIHFHNGFFGYVAVLEGALDNIEYAFKNKQLKETGGLKALPGGLIAEKDGVIHKLMTVSYTHLTLPTTPYV